MGLSRLDDPNMVEVGVGALAVARYPRFLMTAALGSCIGLALWDPVLKQGGLAHIMLPLPLETSAPGVMHRFASCAVPEMANMLVEQGSPRRRLQAKMAGGAAMFRGDTILATVGERNIAEVKRQLGLLNIPVFAEDIGERHARTVEIHLDSGLFVVRSYLYGIKNL